MNPPYLVLINLMDINLYIKILFTGKVRDIYEAGHHVILVSTDRLSAFDRVLAAVPFKGQVCIFLDSLKSSLAKNWVTLIDVRK